LSRYTYRGVPSLVDFSYRMSDWVAICAEEGDDPVEIETEDDGVLLLEAVTAHFPGTTTLKYRNKEKTAFRGVKCIEGKMAPPTGGWDQAPLYICVNPTKVEQVVKRKAESEERETVKKSKQEENPDFDPKATIDLILLGLNPQTTEKSIREYFEKKGEVSLVWMKKSKDANVGYAFIRFADKEVEKTMLTEKHNIDGKQAYLKVPNSRQQGDRSERKVYVSYHNEDLTVADLRNHFEQFGDVEDVFIPTPWRHFCFITFMDKRVAQSLLGREQNLNGTSIMIKSLTNNKEKDGMGNMMGGWDGPMGGMGMMPEYEMRGMGRGLGHIGQSMGGIPMSHDMGAMSMGMYRGGMNVRGKADMGRGMRGGSVGGQREEDGGWPGQSQYGYGPMMGEQSYNMGFLRGKRN